MTFVIFHIQQGQHNCRSPSLVGLNRFCKCKCKILETVYVAPLSGLTQLADPNRFLDTRLILFVYFSFIYFFVTTQITGLTRRADLNRSPIYSNHFHSIYSNTFHLFIYYIKSRDLQKACSPRPALGLARPNGLKPGQAGVGQAWFKKGRAIGLILGSS